MNIKEIDATKTRVNVRDILKDFRRLSLMVHVILDSKEDFRYCDNNIVLNGNFNASYEFNELVKALSTLKGKYFDYVFCYYLKRDKLDHKTIAGMYDVTPKQVERSKATALIRFAKAYKNGELIEYR